MEVAAAAVGLVNATIRTSSQIWTLCELWKDSPREVYLLRDALDHARDFFSQVRQGIVEGTRTGQMDRPSRNPGYEESLRQIEPLLRQGCAIVVEIENIVQGIMEGQSSEPETTAASPGNRKPRRGPDTLAPATLSKRRRIAWLAKAATVAKLRAVLKETCFMVSARLITLNL